MMDGSPFPDTRGLAHVALHQHPAHAAALRAIGATVRLVHLAEGGWANVLLRRFEPVTLALVPRGPVWPCGRAPGLRDLRDLRHALPARSALIVNAETELPRSLRIWPLVTPQTVAEWDLRPGPATLHAGLHQKWRNRLRTAATLPTRHAAMPADPAHWLLRHDAVQARARGYRPWPPALIAAHAARGGAHLFTAGPPDSPSAAQLFLLHGARATYQVGWTSDAGRAANAHTRLMWQAALALRDAGAQTLDLGTLDTQTAAGLARFKLGTGARPRALGPTVLVL